MYSDLFLFLPKYFIYDTIIWCLIGVYFFTFSFVRSQFVCLWILCGFYYACLQSQEFLTISVSSMSLYPIICLDSIITNNQLWLLLQLFIIHCLQQENTSAIARLVWTSYYSCAHYIQFQLPTNLLNICDGILLLLASLFYLRLFKWNIDSNYVQEVLKILNIKCCVFLSVYES